MQQYVFRRLLRRAFAQCDIEVARSYLCRRSPTCLFYYWTCAHLTHHHHHHAHNVDGDRPLLPLLSSPPVDPLPGARSPPSLYAACRLFDDVHPRLFAEAIAMRAESLSAPLSTFSRHAARGGFKSRAQKPVQERMGEWDPWTVFPSTLAVLEPFPLLQNLCSVGSSLRAE